MNKKIKKAAALMAAAVLCLSMSMSVFASDMGNQENVGAPSVEDPEIGQGGDQTVEEEKTDAIQIGFGEGKDKNGNKVTVISEAVSQEVEKVLNDEKAVKDILKDAGYKVPTDSKVVVLGSGDFKTVNSKYEEIEQDISGGAEMVFELGYSVNNEYVSTGTGNADNLKDLKDGDTIYLLHQKADGTWEVIEGKVSVYSGTGGFTSYSVKATMTGFSPVAFIKVMSDGKVVVMDKDEKAVKQIETRKSADKVKTTTVTAKKSPKTGE